MLPLIVLLARIAFAACSLLTAYGAFAPPTAGQLQLLPWDKAQHFCAFFALAASGVVAWPRLPLWRIAVGLSLAGAMIEVIQATPLVGRDADPFDWVADTLAVGAVMGCVLAARFRRAAAGP
jgi:VanZ family protein